MPTFVVGDIHGYPAVLARLLRDAGLVDRKVRWTGGDARLWLVGDLVDRGRDGIGTIDLVRRLEREGDVRCLLGNHEAVMLAVSRFGDGRASGLDALFESYLLNGGQPSDLERFRPEHAAWIEQLPAVARDGDWLLLHSDTDLYLRFGRSIEEINRTISSILTTGDADVVEDLLGSLADRMVLSDPESVDRLLAALGGMKIVHGHTPIAFVIETDPKLVVAPLEYGGGRVLNVDHCLFAGGQGFITELPAVSRDELGTKPSDVAP